MTSSAWGTGACEACRTVILRGGGEAPLVQLGRDGSGYIGLDQCRLCGALWRSSLREGHVITEQEARREFPEVEIPERPA